MGSTRQTRRAGRSLAAMLLANGIAASLLPTRRVCRVDPIASPRAH